MVQSGGVSTLLQLQPMDVMKREGVSITQSQDDTHCVPTTLILHPNIIGPVKSESIQKLLYL